MQNNFFLKIKFSYPILFAVIINSAFADQDSIKAGEQKAMLCTACHGVEKSVNPEWPNLSQQSKKYLVDQLHAFRDGKRKKNPIILNLSIFPCCPCSGSLGLLLFGALH